MKYITLIIGLLVVGCGKQEQTDTNESTNTNEVDGATAKPVKELTKEDLIGTYEVNYKGKFKYRLVFLRNGAVEIYQDGKKEEYEAKWKIKDDGEIHFEEESGRINVYRINSDGSMTQIEMIKDGRVKSLSKEEQITFKKIK